MTAKQAHGLIPSGAQTYSKSPARFPKGAPRRVVMAQGAYVYDEQGHSYIDCVNGLGAVILGHGDETWQQAVRGQLDRGVAFPLPTQVEQDLARRMVEGLPGGLDMVRFGKNGCDVTGAAVRIARAATGRERIIYNGYHGHHDWSMGYPPKNGGIPICRRVARKNRPIPPGYSWDLMYLEDQFIRWEPAAVVLEPVISANPVIPWPASNPHVYWDALRQLCDRYGVLLILDEMVTAFRIGFPGAVSEWEIDCDLWCGAKALANGLPLTALVGRRELMERIEQDVFYSTTHAGEALSLAAGVATWDLMATRGPPQAIGRAFGLEASQRIEELGLELEVSGYQARPVILGADAEVFGRCMVEAGMLWQGYLNASWAHEGVLVEMLERLGRAMRRTAEVRTGGG